MSRIFPLFLLSILSLSGESTYKYVTFEDKPFVPQFPLSRTIKYPAVPALLFNNIIKALESGEIVNAGTLRKYRGNVGRVKGKLSKEQAARVWALYDKYKDSLMGTRKSKKSKVNSISAVSLEGTRATLFGYLFRMIPPHMMKRIQLMNDFPKLGEQKAVSIRRKMNINPVETRWRSTGLYLAPSHVLEVTVDSNVAKKGRELSAPDSDHGDDG